MTAAPKTNPPSKSKPGLKQGSIIACMALACTAAAWWTGCKLPAEPSATYDRRFLDQGWSVEQRQNYYHMAQGTQIIPYDWFMALEQARSTNFFHSNEMAARFRLLPDPNPMNNPDRLPVGVVKDVDDVDGRAHLGLTCAACHTGEIHYRGMALRIEGGPGMLDLTSWVGEMFKALEITHLSPSKFDRFARRVLGVTYSKETKALLDKELHAKMRDIFAQLWIGAKDHLYPTKDGFGRQDALGRGGNNGFSKIGIESNLAISDAPVSYPSVWEALNWDWVQYNGSIQQPMGRNVGEALGVGAVAVLKGKPEDLYKSTVKLDNLHTLEAQIRTLKPPAWPEDILGRIDRKKAERGSALFEQHCKGCHNSQTDSTGNWIAHMIPIEEIGTDPKQAVNLINHKIDTGDLGLGTIPAGTALQMITENVGRRKFKELQAKNGWPDSKWNEFTFGRTNNWRAIPAYRAHHLLSIWASPPYLHNGSVPNIFQLLSTREERSRIFYTGNLEYDPALMGYQYASFPGGFQFDVSKPGNSNAGHEFRDGPTGKGVIGPKLTYQEKMDIIEYLKTR